MAAGSCFREGSWSRCSTTFDKLAALAEYCCYRQRSDARCYLLLRMRSLGEGGDMLNLLTEDEVAKQLNVSVASIRRWRLRRPGPHFVKVGSLVRDRQEDLEAWLASLPTGASRSTFNSPNIGTSPALTRTPQATSYS